MQRPRCKDGSHLPIEALPIQSGGGLRNQLRKDGFLLNRHVGVQEHNRDAKENLTHIFHNSLSNVNSCMRLAIFSLSAMPGRTSAEPLKLLFLFVVIKDTIAVVSQHERSNNTQHDVVISTQHIIVTLTSCRERLENNGLSPNISTVGATIKAGTPPSQ